MPVGPQHVLNLVCACKHVSKWQQILPRFFFLCVCVDKSRLAMQPYNREIPPCTPSLSVLVVTCDESHEMPAWTRNAVMATAIYKIAAESTHGTYGDMDAWTKGEKVQALLPLSLLPPHVAHPRPGASL